MYNPCMQKAYEMFKWILFILTTVTCCRAVLFENQLVLGHAILLSDQLTKVPILVHLWVHTVL